MTHYHPTELIIKPLSTAPSAVRVGDDGGIALIADIEQNKLTGCLRTYCAAHRSKGATLLYQGRVVGCVYSEVNSETSDTTEKSFRSVWRDLCECPDTEALIYDLPTAYVMGMSSVFIGYPVARNDRYGPREYFDYIENWILEKRLTACLAVFDELSQDMYLTQFYDGIVCGAYNVKTQEYGYERAVVDELLKHKSCVLEVAILPLEEPGSNFGFSPSKH